MWQEENLRAVGKVKTINFIGFSHWLLLDRNKEIQHTNTAVYTSFHIARDHKLPMKRNL